MNTTGRKDLKGDGNQDTLENPQIVELISEYTEKIRTLPLVPEDFIDDYSYQEATRQEILQEMRFAATLEHIYSNHKYPDTEIPGAARIERAKTKITKFMLEKLRKLK